MTSVQLANGGESFAYAFRRPNGFQQQQPIHAWASEDEDYDDDDDDGVVNRMNMEHGAGGGVDDAAAEEQEEEEEAEEEEEGNCVVCGQATCLSCAGCESIFYCSPEHQVGVHVSSYMCVDAHAFVVGLMLLGGCRGYRHRTGTPDTATSVQT